MPEAAAIAGIEAEFQRRGHVVGARPAAGFDMRAQRGFRVVVCGVGAGIHMPHAAARGQADVPDPAVALRGGDGLAGDGRVRIGVRHLRRQRAIVEQHVLAADHADAVMLAEQQGTQAGAVDEQIACDRTVIAGAQRRDVAVLVRIDAGHVIGHMAHAQRPHAVITQERAELHRVEVIGVIGHAGVFGRGELLRRLARCAQLRLEADEFRERHAPVTRHPRGDQIRVQIALRQHEGMVVIVVVAIFAPADELRRLLEHGVAAADEVGLAHADATQRVAHRRPCALAHADGGHVG